MSAIDRKKGGLPSAAPAWMRRLRAASCAAPATVAPVVAPPPATGTAYLVVDCSGSMAHEKLAFARRGGLDFARGAAAARYRVGLIAFGSEARHIQGPTESATAIEQALAALAVDGSTNMADAIRLVAARLGRAPLRRAMCVVTDGMPDSVEDALAAAAGARRLGIDILCVGTVDADRAFLERLATRADLARQVAVARLASGIAEMARLLPKA